MSIEFKNHLIPTWEFLKQARRESYNLKMFQNYSEESSEWENSG